MSDGSRSFQTGPGRIRLGVDPFNGGVGVPADRARTEANAAEAPIPLRFSGAADKLGGRLVGYIAPARYVDQEQLAKDLRESARDTYGDDRLLMLQAAAAIECAAEPRYVDPEQTASRTRHWDDAA